MALEGLHPASWILFFYPCLDAWFDVLCCLLRFITCPASGFGCVLDTTKHSFAHCRHHNLLPIQGNFHYPLHERDFNSWKASLPYSSTSCILVSLPLTSSLLHYPTSTRVLAFHLPSPNLGSTIHLVCSCIGPQKAFRKERSGFRYWYLYPQLKHLEPLASCTPARL